MQLRLLLQLKKLLNRIILKINKSLIYLCQIFFLINSVKLRPFGNSFLILGPKLYKNNIGAAVPKAYPITAPIPPQVDAAAGPNNIHAPKAEATKLVVNENVFSSLSPTI